jgi:hypothetical protein
MSTGCFLSSETKFMSELQLKMIRNIATVFAGKEDPHQKLLNVCIILPEGVFKITLQMLPNLILSNLVLPSINLSWQLQENDDRLLASFLEYAWYKDLLLPPEDDLVKHFKRQMEDLLHL